MNATPTAPPPARPEACNSCRFWTAPAAGPLGTCRRFPLAERKEGGDWCGEFAAVARGGPVVVEYDETNPQARAEALAVAKSAAAGQGIVTVPVVPPAPAVAKKGRGQRPRGG